MAVRKKSGIVTFLNIERFYLCHRDVSDFNILVQIIK